MDQQGQSTKEKTFLHPYMQRLAKKKIAASNEIRNWFAELLAFQERAILVAAGNQMAKDDKHMRQGSQTQTRSEIDSLMLISYPPTSHGRGPPSRFSPPQRGPFIVKEVNGNRIIVEGINDGTRRGTLNPERQTVLARPTRQRS